MNSIVDSHCHLDFKDFSHDLNEVIERASKNGVDYLLAISINLEDFRKIYSISRSRKNIWCSTGIHPNNVPEFLNSDDIHFINKTLKKNTENTKVIGIGETGLDYYRGNRNIANQKKIFELQIQLATETNLPIIVHTRDADSDTIEFLNKAKKLGTKGLIHCFSSSLQFAKVVLDAGFYISFSGMVTYKKNSYFNDIIKYIPQDRLLIETDSPYLSPEPRRGKRNEPSNIIYTLKHISKIKKISEPDLSNLTTNNFFKLFSKIKSK